PTEALQNRYLALLHEFLAFPSTADFLILLGCAALVALIVSNALAVTVEYFVKRFVARQSYSLQQRILQSSLSQPYSSFLTMNSGEAGQGILGEVREYIDGVLSNYLLLISRLVATIVLLGLLVVVDPVLAITTG